jgi:hypothetical protein
MTKETDGYSDGQEETFDTLPQVVEGSSDQVDGKELDNGEESELEDLLGLLEGARLLSKGVRRQLRGRATTCSR